LKIERLVAILSILANVDRITAQELADRFEVSKRTILRDLDTLNGAGIPIISYPGIGGGVGVSEGYKINKHILSTSDLEKIFTGLSALNSIQQDHAITNLLAKLLPDMKEKTDFQSDYVIDLSSWFFDNMITKKIADIRQAIIQRNCICLEYISIHTRMERVIEPHRLVFKQSNWYVYAFCRERKEFRLFKVRRIASYKILDETFEFHAFEKIEVGKAYGNNVFCPSDQEKQFKIILEYDILNEFFLTDRVDASLCKRSLDGDASVGTICFSASELTWVADFVFGILDKVRVIAPAELKFEIKQRLNKINSLYKGDI
jgi:predicted DNA-binding transcriptional regulator YafY